MENYIPPFDITNKMLELTAEIMESLGKLSHINELEKLPRLRKVSRVKSIHSSLAIENNTLSYEQVTDIINGKRVLGPQEDIIAVQNAFAAYKELDNIDPYNIRDLYRVHGIMMKGLVQNAGSIRSGDVGVIDGNGNVIHAAPPVSMARELIGQLFDWVKAADVHMLIRSSVFHYEFEFIHPFNDGNGRMGRLWQTSLLASWKPIFKYIPIESVIKDNQAEYYQAFQISTSEGKSNAFVLFMLDVIKKAITDIVNDSRVHYNHLNLQINKLMSVMESYPQSAWQIMDRLNLKSMASFRKHYLIPALEAGLIGMTIPDKPTSKNQMYYKV
ncbi:MAG: Fic family protein [Clostridiales bacterium]|nr:Fic family protein [Clostridiales bacterium]